MNVLELLTHSGIPFNRKEQSNAYITCPKCQRDKLSVNVTSGQWHCWSAECEGFGGNFERLRAELSIPNDVPVILAPAPERVKELTPEERDGIARSLENKSAIIKWAATRHLEPMFVIGKVGFDSVSGAVIFPFFDAQGKIIGAKYRSDSGQWIKGTEPDLYTPNHADLTKEKIVLVEGEVDALTLAQFRIPVAATLGATKTKGFPLLDKPRTVYLGYDADAAGSTGADSASSALGAYRCRKVTWSSKDPNDMLKDGADKDAIIKCIKDAVPMVASLKSKNASATLDEFLELASKREQRLSWGFPKLDSLTKGIGGGELIGVLAQAGTGKTTFCVNSACANANAGVNVAIASLEENITTEMTPKLVATLVGRNPGTGGFSEEELEDVRPALKRIHLFTGDADMDAVSEFAREAYYVHDVRLLYIDYLQLIMKDETNVQEVKATVYGLKKLTKELPELCICVIVQPKQTQRIRNRDGSEAPPPRLDLHDARGGAAIGQGVDALLTISAVQNHPNVTAFEYKKVRGHLRVSKRDWIGHVVQLEYDHRTMRQNELAHPVV